MEPEVPEPRIPAQPEPPTLTLTWNPDEQAVGIRFDGAQFKNWDFVILILDMAKRQAEAQLKFQQTQALIAQQQEAQRAQQLRRNLGLG